jgi:hypothetical protein
VTEKETKEEDKKHYWISAIGDNFGQNKVKPLPLV